MAKDECIFSKVVSGEIPVEKVYEGDDLGVFDCTISNDKLLPEASLNVFQPQ